MSRIPWPLRTLFRSERAKVLDYFFNLLEKEDKSYKSAKEVAKAFKIKQNEMKSMLRNFELMHVLESINPRHEKMYRLNIRGELGLIYKNAVTFRKALVEYLKRTEQEEPLGRLPPEYPKFPVVFSKMFRTYPAVVLDYVLIFYEDPDEIFRSGQIAEYTSMKEVHIREALELLKKFEILEGRENKKAYYYVLNANSKSMFCILNLYKIFRHILYPRKYEYFPYGRISL